MIANDQQLQTTLDRIAWFQNQVAYLRKTETNPVNYRAAVCGFLAEIDRMQLEVREYLSFLPAERVEAASSSHGAGRQDL
ncbi:MAG: hypothetical protein ACRERD_35005 [Candidatus Binatia bacterium]